MMMTTFEKGVLQGKREGQRELVQMLLEDHFGSLSPRAQQRLEALPAERLGVLARALLKAQSLQELGLED